MTKESNMIDEYVSLKEVGVPIGELCDCRRCSFCEAVDYFCNANNISRNEATDTVLENWASWHKITDEHHNE